MKKDYTKFYAFTLAEAFIVILIISIISIVSLGVQKNRTTYINKFMTYSAVYNLQQGIKQLLNTGCNYVLNDNTTDFYQISGNSICTAKYSVLPQFGDISAAGHTKRGLCVRLSEVFNITDTPSCTLTVPGGTTNFSGYTPNFTATNGIKFYNFGGTNALQTVYTVYLDIDGNSRSGKLDDDVIKVKISTAGDVLLDVASRAAADINYLSASIRYYDSNNSKYVTVISGVNYRNAVCTGNLVPTAITSSASYCGSGVNSYDNTSYNASASCPTIGNPCELKLDKPHVLMF